MPLNLFYTMVQKSQKMTKNSNQGGGSCLKRNLRSESHSVYFLVGDETYKLKVILGLFVWLNVTCVKNSSFLHRRHRRWSNEIKNHGRSPNARQEHVHCYHANDQTNTFLNLPATPVTAQVQMTDNQSVCYGMTKPPSP